MTKTGDKKVSQRAMVQAALDSCGWDAKPTEMQGFIKDQFSKELAPNIISNYKSQIKREGNTRGSGRPRKTAAAGLQIEDFQMVSTLVKKLGADKVKLLINAVIVA